MVDSPCGGDGGSIRTQHCPRGGSHDPGRTPGGILEAVILSRGWSLFLVAVGVFNWAIWPRFSLAIWDDARAWTGRVGHSSPTSFLLVHAVLVITAVVVGTIVGVLGVRGFLVDRRVRTARSVVAAQPEPSRR